MGILYQNRMAILSGLLVISALLVVVRGHGMLVDPPNRGSMWRFGFNTPPNYNDNAQYCGGRNVQWAINNGQCGECGDDFRLSRPRPAENGGTFGLGIIGKTYKKGQTITVTARITANHLGNFDFHLCPLKSSRELETQACFSQWPLRLATGELRYPLGRATGDIRITLQLPQNLVCDQCVLRWTYETGNSWGVCTNGTGAVGCGPQEHFISCSDISIA